VDTARTSILNSFYAELNYKVGYPVRITVVHSIDVNAYAIPGGHIIVNDAILEGMKTPEELAALLGHEATHIAERHSLRTLFRSVARQLFLSLLIGNNSGVVGFLVSNADELKGLQYSRSLESDADEKGILLMEKSGLNTEGMLHLIQMLQRVTIGATTVSYLSTHPDFEKRLADIKAKIKEHPGASATPTPLKKLFHSLYE
jgi:predicted Zn-dependent protease